jgi:hypothetical protein
MNPQQLLPGSLILKGSSLAETNQTARVTIMGYTAAKVAP